MKTYILYHGNCNDGFMAAYLMSKLHGPEAEYIPVWHYKEPPEMEPNSEIWIVDFSYDRDTLTTLCQNNNVVYVLDHHESAMQTLDNSDNWQPSNLHAIFDMSKCGARIVSERIGIDHELLDYIEDRDLWIKQLPNIDDVDAAIRSYPYDFSVWDTFTVEKLKNEGVAIQRFRRKQIEQHKRKAMIFDFAGYQVPGVECTSKDLVSDIAGELCQDANAPFAFTWHWNEEDKLYVYSLRSRSEFKCLMVARWFGGGGHPQACGCSSKERIHQ